MAGLPQSCESCHHTVIGVCPDRAENIRRVGEVAKLFVDSGVITLASFISPYCRDRDAVRTRLGSRDFIEVFMKVCSPWHACSSSIALQSVILLTQPCR